MPEDAKPKILVLATLSGGYAGADAVGQLHASYPANIFVLPIVSGGMFSEDFYLSTFEKGIDAIIVMFSGTDCPYRGAAQRAADIINKTYTRMTARGINPRRLKLVAICTVCTKPFLKEVNAMNELIAGIGPVRAELDAAGAR